MEESTYSSLSNEEKMQMIRSHIKNIQHSKYNIELSILAENAIDVPNESLVIGYQMQLEDASDKQNALEQELLRISSLGE
jgi:hypothetical protein